jgi:signal transduction histidine kinase
MGPRDRTALVPLPPMRPEQAQRLLAPPWIPTMLAASVARACRARPLGLPVHLALPHAALGPRFARALHALTGPHGDLLLATDERPELRGLPLGATIVVDPTRLDDEAVVALAALLDDGDAWVLAITAGDVVLPGSLRERLATVVVDVPPLARRQLELPSLSAAILQTLAARAGRPTPALAPAARTRLASQPWPEDMLELEALLGRALASTDGDTVDTVALGFEPAPSAEVAIEPEPEPPAPEEAPAAPVADPRLEMLLAELAHEILNPLSTIKMMLGHLPQLLADAEARDALSGRADDAIERVDELLQNVIAYARLGEPAREAVPVALLLDRLLGEVEPELAARSIRVRRTGSDDVTCVGDPAQLEYGFRNLLAGVVREVPPRDEFAIDTAQNGVVAVQFAAREAAVARLRAMVATDGAPDLGDPTLLPLPFTLARAVIERNGGSLAVHEDERGPTTLVVRLPTTTTATE